MAKLKVYASISHINKYENDVNDEYIIILYNRFMHRYLWVYLINSMYVKGARQNTQLNNFWFLF